MIDSRLGLMAYRTEMSVFIFDYRSSTGLIMLLRPHLKEI